jgi:hypothetical protein
VIVVFSHYTISNTNNNKKIPSLKEEGDHRKETREGRGRRQERAIVGTGVRHDKVHYIHV